MDDYKSFAIRAHGDQKYGDQPYSVHLQAVAQVLTDFGYVEEEYQAAAWLHDVLEDTDTSQAHLQLAFGGEVFALVHAVTGEGSNRKERQASIIKKLHHCKPACVLKLADRIANLEAAIQEHNRQGKMAMYHSENTVFEKCVKKHVPVEMWDRLMDAFNYGHQHGWC